MSPVSRSNGSSSQVCTIPLVTFFYRDVAPPQQGRLAAAGAAASAAVPSANDLDGADDDASSGKKTPNGASS